MQARLIEPTARIYTSLLQGYNSTRKSCEVFALFKELVAKGIEPEKFAYPEIIDALSREGKTIEAFKLGCFSAQDGT